MFAFRHKNVGGLDVAVNDAFAVRRIERVGNFDRQVEHFVNAQRFRLYAAPQSLALQKLHGDEDSAVLLADVVDRADVWVAQRRGSLGFPAKPFECLAIAVHIVRQQFERYKAAQTRVFGLVHHPHAAAAEVFKKAVMRDGLPQEWVGTVHCRRILSCAPRQVNEAGLARESNTSPLSP